MLPVFRVITGTAAFHGPAGSPRRETGARQLGPVRAVALAPVGLSLAGGQGPDTSAWLAAAFDLDGADGALFFTSGGVAPGTAGGQWAPGAPGPTSRS